MSAQPATADRRGHASSSRLEESEPSSALGSSSGSSGSAPYSIPSQRPNRGRRSGSFDNPRQQQHHGSAPASSGHLGSSPADRRYNRSGSGSGSGRRYGAWPPPGSSPAEGGHLRPAGSSGSGGSSGRMNRQGSGSVRTFNWPAYMDRQQLQQAMKRGQVFRAKFRVNAANRSEGFCTLDGLPNDLLVRGDVNHNRAVEGDEVAVLPFKLSDWFKVYKEQEKLAELGLMPEGDDDPVAVAERLIQLAIDANDDEALAAAQSPWLAAGTPSEAIKKLEQLLLARPDLRVTGKVVSVIEPSRKREAIVGVLLPPATALAASAAPPPGTNPSPVAAAAAAALAAGTLKDCLMLFPLDPRLPKCIVGPESLATLPQALKDEAVAQDLTTRTFVTGCITEWPAGSPFPYAEVRQSLGPSDDIEAGTKALLSGENIRDEDFNLEVYACLPKVPWRMSPADLENRADFTSWRIFSIDPITARDLDDALSIQPLEGGRWRIGVHIADVASFVKPNTALDEEARVRGTSVYLVQRVIPMLPRLLCEELCSLHPGDPRFAFSIVWEVDNDGHIYQEWAGRSVISSCAKLAYPMVQQMIEGSFDPATWSIQLYNGTTWEQVRFDCLALHGIASRLRLARFKSGALRMTNTRLSFALDTGGNPVSASPYQQLEANFLVEEFMLLANMRVALYISKAFPHHALLSKRKMKALKEVGDKLGVVVDDTTAGALALSLQALKDKCEDDASKQAVMLLATKPMQLAQYFCTCISPDPHSWRHYALAVGHYTHFTSPIRRYPDLIVHRLLAAALELAQQQQAEDTSDLLSAPMADRAELPEPVDYSDAIYDPAFAAATQATEAEDAAGSQDSEGESDESEDSEAAAAATAKAEATATVLAKHQLPEGKVIERIATHSNETKLAARTVSDGSLKLYLCLMLKSNPVVTMAVAVSLGGDKFFTAYIPELGCEVRLTLSMMGLPLSGTWDEASETLTISHKTEEQPQEGDSEPSQLQQQQPLLGAADSNYSSSSDGTVQQPSNRQLGLNSEQFSLKTWLDHMQGAVLNPHHIAKTQLPLQVRQFTHIPVVVGSYNNSHTCHVEDVAAKLWVPCGSADEAASSRGPQPAADLAMSATAATFTVPAAAGQTAVASAMPLETLLED